MTTPSSCVTDSATAVLSEMSYTPEYYAELRHESISSARQILPIILDVLAPTSIVDVGCGTGPWLAIAIELGVEDVLGVDGEWVDPNALSFPSDRFLARDLRKPLQVGRRFDLALSLEVAEHLPGTAAEILVQSLVSLAPAILFSAAIPMQGGVEHVNEQWQSYWAAHFAEHGYRPMDLARPLVWTDSRVAPYYAQNVLLYSHHSLLACSPALTAASTHSAAPLDLVHPHIFTHQTDVTSWSTSKLLGTSRAIAWALSRTLYRSVQRRSASIIARVVKRLG